MIRQLLLGSSVLASFQIVPAGAETIAITNARIITMAPSGDVENGTVLLKDGKIIAVGSRVSLPANTRVLDAQGQFVTPGLMLAPTPLALKDIIGNGGGRYSSDRLTAGYEVAGDFNPRHPHVADARAEGVTRALVSPDPQQNDRLFAGQAALVQLGTSGEAVLDAQAALYVSTTERASTESSGGIGGMLSRLTSALDEARAFSKSPSRYDSSRLADLGLSRADLTVLGRIVAGREPLLIEVNRAEAIRHVLAFAKAQHLRIILSGVSEGWLVASEISKSQMPVIIDGEMNQANSFEDLNASYENAALLTKAGVAVSFKPTFSRIGILDRSPRWAAGRAARFGLRLHDALAAITINPARALGLGQRYGSIEIGKQADIVIWSGDPLETTTTVRTVLIDGVEQNLTTRSDELRNRYMPVFKSN